MTNLLNDYDQTHRSHPAYDELTGYVRVWADMHHRSGPAPTEEEVATHVEKCRPLIDGLLDGMEEDEVTHFLAKVTDDILSELQTAAPTGTPVMEYRHVPWLEERWPSHSWKWWGAYKKLLQRQNRPVKMVHTLEEDTKNVLDLTGNPEQPGRWQRRGLVMGDVQSGKTSNYIGLMNMAYDAGFRFFIVIGGHTEDLRSQTQERVDEGFIGSISRRTDSRNQGKNRSIGVGEFRDEGSFSITTVTDDFRKSSTNVRVSNIDQTIQGPVVMVVKKNSRILANLAEWLSNSSSGKGLELPALVIDDESDFASIDTSAEEDDPTAVNAAIRDILRKFDRASYVGYTATPFANVLIDPDVEQDLFPRDFIYTLFPPGNYMDAIAYFDKEANGGSATEHVRNDMSGAAQAFPFRHKNGHRVHELPASLEKALDTFLLACVHSDLDGATHQPRSMLVNVSRYKQVQGDVHDLVSEHIEETKDMVSNQLPILGPGDPLPKHVARLRDVWYTEYSDLGHSWEAVQEQLIESVARVETELVNGDTAKERKDREAQRAQRQIKTGARTVAVGGTILSRGITLDGLTVSYFHQRTQLSDSLLQMGRWFGYRDGYRHLVRIWIDEEVMDWFLFTARTLAEIRDDIVYMHQARMTPQEFGLKIQRHPEALKITAANKMRHADRKTLTMSLDGQSVETTTATFDPSGRETNRVLFEDFLKQLQDDTEAPEKSTHIVSGTSLNHVIIRGVGRDAVQNLLDHFVPGQEDVNFARSEDQPSWVAKYSESLTGGPDMTWDVAFMSGSGPEVALPGGMPEHRSNVRDNLEMVQSAAPFLRFLQRRLASAGHLESVAIAAANGSEEHWATARKLREGHDDIGEATVSKTIDRPMLLVYRVTGSYRPGESDETTKFHLDDHVFGLKVAFPPMRNLHGHVIENPKKTEYVVNKTWLAMAGLEDEGAGDDV